MSRRVAMFQILYNPVIVATFVALFLLELWSGVPLMKALLLTIPLEQPIAVLGMLSDLLGSVTAIFEMTGSNRTFWNVGI